MCVFLREIKAAGKKGMCQFCCVRLKKRQWQWKRQWVEGPSKIGIANGKNFLFKMGNNKQTVTRKGGERERETKKILIDTYTRTRTRTSLLCG